MRRNAFAFRKRFSRKLSPQPKVMPRRREQPQVARAWSKPPIDSSVHGTCPLLPAGSGHRLTPLGLVPYAARSLGCENLTAQSFPRG